MALGYLWAGLCWLCTALYQVTSIGLYAEEVAARDRSPPCPANRILKQAFDEPELPSRRRNLTSWQAMSDSGVEQGTEKNVGFHVEIEEIPSGTFSRDAPTATSTPVGSHSVTKPESYEVSCSGKVNGYGEYRPTSSSASSPPVKKKSMIQYLSPQPSLVQHHSHHTWVVMCIRAQSRQGKWAVSQRNMMVALIGLITWSTLKLCHNGMGGLT